MLNKFRFSRDSKRNDRPSESRRRAFAEEPVRGNGVDDESRFNVPRQENRIMTPPPEWTAFRLKIKYLRDAARQTVQQFALSFQRRRRRASNRTNAENGHV
jgi:hypothetical protein